MQEYLNTAVVKKLQVSGGSNVLPGWLHTCKNLESPRIHFLDITCPIPFADSTFDYVFSKHMIDHMTYYEGLMMFMECNRIMKPGARIRISFSDINFLIRLANDSTEQDIEYIKWASQYFLPTMRNPKWSQYQINSTTKITDFLPWN